MFKSVYTVCLWLKENSVLLGFELYLLYITLSHILVLQNIMYHRTSRSPNSMQRVFRSTTVEPNSTLQFIFATATSVMR